MRKKCLYRPRCWVAGVHRLTAMDKENGNGVLLFDRVEHELRTRIGAMLEAAETMLPQKRELAEACGVSIRTVRAALACLKIEQLVRAVPGKGAFLVPATDRKSLTLVLCKGVAQPSMGMAAETTLRTFRSHGMRLFSTCGRLGSWATAKPIATWP